MGDLSDAMTLVGALLIIGGGGLLAGAMIGVRRRLRAESRAPARTAQRPRIRPSALLADTVPLRPVSAPQLVLPRSRSAAPRSSAPDPSARDSSPRPGSAAPSLPSRPTVRPARPAPELGLDPGDPAPEPGWRPLDSRRSNARPGRMAGGRPTPARSPNSGRPAAPPRRGPAPSGALPVPSPPPPATGVPAEVPLRLVSAHTAVGRVGPPSGVVPPVGSAANWNGPTVVTAAVERQVRARNARSLEESRRPH